MIPREALMETARVVYRSYGFVPIETPVLEYAEILAGYSYMGDLWRHAQYHGELVVEGDTWDISDQDLVKRLAGQNQTVCKVSSDGASGYGIFELIIFGLYEPYGFQALTDVAK